MKAAEYTTVNKSTWGDGPWQQEPDKAQFSDEATGLPCLIVRSNIGGNMCGYVGVPEGHPAFGKDWSELEVDVHGGPTFSDFCQPADEESHGICHVPEAGEPDHVWWIGFDCAHGGDLSPGYAARHPAFRLGEWETYRTIDYVKGEVRSLAHQLAAMTEQPQ